MLLFWMYSFKVKQHGMNQNFLLQQQHAVGLFGGTEHQQHKRVWRPFLQGHTTAEEEASVGRLRKESQNKDGKESCASSVLGCVFITFSSQPAEGIVSC